MPQLPLAASSSETAENPNLRLLPSPRPLRLDELTPEIAELICKVIRLDGLADHHAGALARVRRATLERWKAEDEGFALALELARAEFEWKLVQKIKNACKRDGTPDWRAQVWLLKNYSAEGVVKPVRAAGAQKRANLPETPAAPPAAVAAPAQTAQGTERTTTERSAPPTRSEWSRPGGARENASILPEMPARPGGSPLAGRIVPAPQRPSFVPETTQPAEAGKQRAA
ncbi:MAG TPA: hypothetical protein VGO11_24650 [Chthoniobacteraceae bacterium]|jgi:hypothetical protein|nr:hypothetical protein [Chthoniobacteraceae bacterium]